MTDSPPQIENSPGLKWRRIKTGWQALWRARADLVATGYPIKSARLWQSTVEKPAPDAFTIGDIQDRCQGLQSEMLLWGRSGFERTVTYDGTWASLIACYRTDKDSPYRKKEYVTRKHYDTLCRIIERDAGADRIADTDARRILRLYDGWIEPKEGQPQKIAMGHALVGMMRTLATFGKTLLKCKACREVSSDLHDMRFKGAKPREVHLSAEQVIAIRRHAHTMKEPYRHSIALAQAMQFDVASGMR